MKLALCAFLLTTLFAQACAITARSESRNGDATPRVAGGTVAVRGQFPWHVTLTTDVFGFCNGALLDAQWVLTSASCAHGVSNFTVTLGSTSIYDMGDNDTMTVVTNTKFVHPAFDARSLINDIALLKFDTPLNLSDSSNAFIAPVRLANQTDLGDDLNGTDVQLSGWGRTSETSSSPVSSFIMYANLTVTSLTECRAAFGMANIHDDMLCTSGEGNRGACDGDEGAPLVAWVGNSWQHVGVASFAAARGCEKGAPTVFARTSGYLEWIGCHMDPEACSSCRRISARVALILPALMAVLLLLNSFC